MASEQAISGPLRLPRAGRGLAAGTMRPLLVRHAPLAAVLAISAALNSYALAQNGYANTFYSAAVKSMLGSLHDFVFNSFDPGGLITVDKPPLALWLQAASAKVFGFGPLSPARPGGRCGRARGRRPLLGARAAASGARRHSPVPWRSRSFRRSSRSPVTTAPTHCSSC